MCYTTDQLSEWFESGIVVRPVNDILVDVGFESAAEEQIICTCKALFTGIVFHTINGVSPLALVVAIEEEVKQCLKMPDYQKVKIFHSGTLVNGKIRVASLMTMPDVEVKKLLLKRPAAAISGGLLTPEPTCPRTPTTPVKANNRRLTKSSPSTGE